jgi:hypothetical protein
MVEQPAANNIEAAISARFRAITVIFYSLPSGSVINFFPATDISDL